MFPFPGGGERLPAALLLAFAAQAGDGGPQPPGALFPKALESQTR